MPVQSAAVMLLLIVGVAVFRERLSAANVASLGLCLEGLLLVNRRWIGNRNRNTGTFLPAE